MRLADPDTVEACQLCALLSKYELQYAKDYRPATPEKRKAGARALKMRHTGPDRVFTRNLVVFSIFFSNFYQENEPLSTLISFPLRSGFEAERNGNKWQLNTGTL